MSPPQPFDVRMRRRRDPLAALGLLAATRCAGKGRWALLLPALISSAAIPAAGQPTGASDPAHSDARTCSACHTCSVPTHQEPCLAPCTRDADAEVAARFRGLHGPDVVILDDLEERYLPVPFDHRGHAEMAQMTRGCAVCHHYTPEGTAHPACKTCHEVSPAREDVRKPGLRGAYHRQCLNCHREWSHETSCSICHPPKAGVESPAPAPTQGDIVGRMHPPIPEPDTELYHSVSANAPGSHVLFRHKEHIHRFGLKCVECHHEDSCSRCHEEGREHVQKVRTLDEHHRPCSTCHDVENDKGCGQCHWSEDQAKPAPFDHASTGWPLSRYHKDASCRNCHEAVPFVKLDPDCNACHADWASTNFNHAVTGQRLDETHAMFDCEDCHLERRFDRPPACNECHEPEEGITFPAKRPGPTVDHAK